MSTYVDPDGSSADSSSSSNISAGGLSHGVIAGLAILGAAVVTLLLVLYYGYWIRRKAKSRQRSDDKHAVGLQWTDISYSVSTKATRRHLGKSSFFSSRKNPQRLAPGRRAVEREHHRMAMEDIELQEPDVRSERKLASFRSSGSVKDDQSVGENRILSQITSQAMPGTLNFILGPSGAGKSSLVDVLAGRQKTGHVQGSLATLHLEGGPLTAQHPTGHQIALVDQDDSVCLPGYMTVREMLSFAAELSLPENVPSAERSQIVEHVIDTLGLTEVAHSRIGDARNRGISGGERRRVSLGVALVGQPKVLIADECTSGLDAFSAHRVIKALRELACGESGGVTVIATLHQPSSQIFALADNVILLGHGSVLFDGQPGRALDFCQSRGIPVPAGHNVADHLLTYAFNQQECQDEDTVEPKSSGEPPATATWRRPVEEGNNSSAGSQAVSSPVGHQQGFAKSTVTRVPLDLNHGGSHTTTTFITQLHALLKRAIIMTKRDRLGAMAHIGGAAVVSVFVGACFFQVKLNLGGFQNRVGSMFFIFIMILFMDLTALVGLAKVRLLMMRERANGLYSPWSWVTAHLALDLILLRAIPVIIMVSIVYWMVGLNHHASNFFLFILIAVLFSWTIAIYNMTISALVEEMGTTILLTSLFVLFNIFMAGFLMSLDSMPAAVRWLRWIAPAKYALEAVASNELKNLKFEDTFAGVPISTDVSLFANKLFGFQDGSYYRDLIVLACGFLVGFGVLLFSSVWWRMRELR